MSLTIPGLSLDVLAERSLWMAMLKSPITQESGGNGGKFVQKTDLAVPLSAGAYIARMLVVK